MTGKFITSLEIEAPGFYLGPGEASSMPGPESGKGSCCQSLGTACLGNWSDAMINAASRASWYPYHQKGMEFMACPLKEADRFGIVLTTQALQYQCILDPFQRIHRRTENENCSPPKNGAKWSCKVRCRKGQKSASETGTGGVPLAWS